MYPLVPQLLNSIESPWIQSAVITCDELLTPLWSPLSSLRGIWGSTEAERSVPRLWQWERWGGSELCWELRLPGVFWGLTRALQLRLFSLLHFKAAVCDLAQSHPWSLRGKWLMWVKKIHLGTYGKNPDRQNVKSFSWTLSNQKGSYSLRLQWPDRWRTWADWRYEGGVGMGTKYTVWLSQAWLPACSKISVREKERRWWKGKVPLLRMPVGNRIFLAYQ